MFARHALFTMLVIVAGLIIAATVYAYWDYTQDDVFITFAYSRNIAEGRGFVFNAGEQVQGTTTPLYTLVMTAVYWLTDDLLHAGNFLGGIFLLVTCILMIIALRRWLSVYGVAAVVLFTVTSSLMYISLGMETLMYGMILLAAFALWERGNVAWAFVAAAALTWTRADGVVLAGVFGLMVIWETYRKQFEQQALTRMIKLGLVYCLAILPWFAFAWLYFGSPLPNTFGAKSGILEGTLFLDGGWSLRDSVYGNNPLHFAALLLILIGIWQAWQRPPIRPIAFWTIAYGIGYTVLNVNAFWYFTPWLLGLLMMTVMGGEWLGRQFTRFLPRTAVIGMGAVIVVLSMGLGLQTASTTSDAPERMAGYRLVGEWIKENTPEDATILVGDLGIVGYYAERRAIDFFGLIVPDMYFYTPEYATIKYKVDYLVATQFYFFPRYINQPWVGYHYVPEVQISVPGDFVSPMTVYRRRLPLIAPVQVYQGLDLPLTCVVEEASSDILPGETFARLYAPDGEPIDEYAHLFLWHQYPAPASLGAERLVEQVAFPVQVEPGRYTWELECDVISSGEVEVLPLSAAPDYIPVDARWGDFVELNGILMTEGTQTWSGGSLGVALDWQVLMPTEGNHTVFMELVDANGQVMARQDAPPRHPSSTWQTDNVIAGEWRINLPPNLPAGEYSLRVGWFNPENGESILSNEETVLPVTITNHWPEGSSGYP